MLSYLSKTPGIGGTIKNKPEDFMVEEIGIDGNVFELNKKIEKERVEGKFTHFILQKMDWSTADAIKRIGKALRISHSRFNSAGTKDKNAVTTQLVSVFGMEPEQVLNLELKDIEINGAWKANGKVRLGQLLGNRFTIKVLFEDERDLEHVAYKIYDELDGKVPNYFGEQRFGSTRRNTHIVGEKLIRGDFEGAALEYLANSEGELNEQAKLARKELAEDLDFGKALKNFPKHLRLERSMLYWLAEHPVDYVNGFRKFPRNILLLFVHAFQSNLFNSGLSERIAKGEVESEEGEYLCGEDEFGFPEAEIKGEKWLVGKLIGCETELNEREKELLGGLGIEQENFKMKGIPEINSKGTYRTLFTPLKNFSFDGNTFRFDLSSGSYATVALREFLDRKS